ncbi:MAG: hypothetical protein N5P05_002704 [Chroococcopsis gigantea SAG 12.99]|jgi:hypothetical protein|nr:hypothetical protein [Chlorogloea purpurea SAG 13.99]MDV3001098.1 hypothetical protein [Chroococcopsis gigantea SAG 12.99]
MSDKLQQIQDVLGFNNSSSTGKAKNEEGSPEPTTFSATSPDVPLDDDLESEFQQHFTYHSFASHPLSKLSIVALGAAGVVGFLVLFYSLVQNPMANLHSSNPKEKGGEAPKENLFSGDPQKTEKDQLLAQLALSQQAQQMERHQSERKFQRSVRGDRSAIVKAGSGERNVPSTSKSSSRITSASTHLPTNTGYNTARYSSTPSRNSSNISNRRERFDGAEPRRTPSQIPLVPLTGANTSLENSRATVSEGNPQKRWQDLVALGSFKPKGNTGNSRSSGQLIPPVTETDQQTKVDETPIVSGVPEHSQPVPVQKLKGRIEGGIAVPVNRTSRDDTAENLMVSIVLDSPIQDKDSRAIVPTGARLTATVKVNGPMISLVGRKLAFEIDGQYQETEIEADAIAISGGDGPLIADVKTVGADGGGLSANGWGQLATALGGIAGIDKATNLALVFNALGGYNSRPSRSEGIKIYTINEGTPVTVRLTRPLNLPVPSPKQETTPELDFE